MIENINKLKDKLNKLLESKLASDSSVIDVSRELDLLIIEYYSNKESDNNNDYDDDTIITDNE